MKSKFIMIGYMFVVALAISVHFSSMTTAEDISMATVEGNIGIECLPGYASSPETDGNSIMMFETATATNPAEPVSTNDRNVSSSLAYGQLILSSQLTDEFNATAIAQKDFVFENENVDESGAIQTIEYRDWARQGVLAGAFLLLTLMAISGSVHKSKLPARKGAGVNA